MLPPLHIAIALLLVESLVLAGAGEARAEETPEQPPRTYVDIDFTLLNAGVSAAEHVVHGVYLGAGFSFLPALPITTLREYPLEHFDARLFVRYEPVSWFQVEGGPRFSVFEPFRLCIFGPCATPPTSQLFGPYASVVAGVRHFKLGPRVEIAHRSDTGEWGILFYPLILHIELTP